MSRMEQTEFSAALSKIISESTLSIRELSRKSGVSREAIRRWMNGTVSGRLELVEYVLEVLGYKIIAVPNKPEQEEDT